MHANRVGSPTNHVRGVFELPRTVFVEPRTMFGSVRTATNSVRRLRTVFVEATNCVREATNSVRGLRTVFVEATSCPGFVEAEEVVKFRMKSSMRNLTT